MSKKKIGLLIGAAAVVVGITAAVLALLLSGGKTPGHGNIDEIDWYDINGTEFVIEDADMLYDVVTLSYHYDFAGQTLKLGADIAVNRGNAADWEKKAPAIFWAPIRNFAGTFDGQGHTISGLYAKTDSEPTALFAYTKSSAVIRDLRLENTLFLTAGNLGSASIAADCAGTYQRIYSNAVVRCDYGAVGGLFSKQSGNLVAEECWFDGVVETSHHNIGGIADRAAGAEMVLNHCLSTGTVIGTWTGGAANAGGLVGMAVENARLVINDCFCGGAMELINLYRSGSVLGGGDATSNVTFLDTFCLLETLEFPVSDQITNRVGGPVPITEKNLTGIKAYQWTNLDYENHWACEENALPVLKCFAKSPLDVSGVAKAVAYDWYSEADDEFFISDISQFYAFTLLSYSTDYAGKKIKLASDLKLNDGLAENWIQTPPENLWYPVQSFAGTFDGQGHTVSGVYVYGQNTLGLFSKTKGTGTLKNFRLENSLIHAKAASLINTNSALSGAIVGRGGGTFDSIYTDAIVYAEGSAVGGIIGQVNISGMITNITNCWFDGKLLCVGEDYGYRAGGFIGGHVLGTVNIAHCLNTGAIHTEVNKGSQAGGFVGYLMNECVLHITDCLNACTFDVKNLYSIGGAIGVSYQGTSTTITNAYSARESVSATWGEYVSHSKSTDEVSVSGGAIPVYRNNLTGKSAARWTDLQFDKFWSLRADGLPVPKTLYDGETVSADGVEKIFNLAWYDADKGSGTIYSRADYIGFTMLSWTTDFAGKSVYLGADITLNSGDAANWASTSPAIWSIPMNSFAGTLDGRGHTISGVYQREKATVGLFSKTTKTAVVRNFRLVNSFFDVLGMDRGTDGVMGLSGTVVGRGGGTLDTIYSSAILRARGFENGGIIGQVNLDEVNTFTNLWFDGAVYGAGEEYGYFAGGIAGGVMLGNNRFAHCLFTGTIQTDVTNKGSKVGGIIGAVQNNATASVSDSLSAGTILCGNHYYKGAIMGTMYAKNTVTISNCYADSACALDKKGQYVSAATHADVPAGALTGSAIPVSKANLTGLNGYRWTTLDFDHYWAARDGECPGLRSFVGKPLATASVKKMVDISWYDTSAKTLTVDSAADLYGLYLVSFSDDFAGKTVKLGADIALNTGDASTWGDEVPANSWTPIGAFAGTLDGQGHTISGVYVKTADNYVGFISVLKGGTVKNLRLVNSYMESGATTTGTGGLAGAVDGGGTIDTVYISATVVPGYYNNGGIVGRAANAGTLYITNSEFAGTLTGVCTNNGGIIGSTIHATTAVRISNCLVSGMVAINKMAATGGVLGNTQNGSTAVISDTLVSGTVESKGGGQTGAVFGNVQNGTATLTNVYAAAESCSKGTNGVGMGTPAGSAVILSAEQLKGKNGYRNTELDFKMKRYWSAAADQTPALTAFFTGTALDLTSVQKPDTAWYDESKSEFTITTAAQLEGLAALSKTNDFTGKTVMLGANIDINEGWAAGAEAPDVIWSPIGTFAGTLDGQGHTISGVYVKVTAGNDVGFISTLKGGTVKNLRLVNSYIEGGEESRGVGGVVGTVDGGGTIDSVYCAAAVVHHSYNNGGLTGRATNEGTLTIVNSQFDGTVTGTGYNNGGIIGAAVHDTTVVQISNCLMSGTVTTDLMRASGGVIGNRMNGSTVTVSDTLVSGTVHSGGGGQTGAAAGIIAGQGALTLTNVYATAESTTVASGSVGSNGVGNVGSGTLSGAAAILPTAKLTGVGGYQRTELGFDTFWSAVEGGTPVLTAFYTGTALDLTGVDKTAADVEIATAEELVAFAASSKTDTYAGQLIRLTADIDMSGVENFPMIGANDKMFVGTFDGDGRTISHLTVNGTAQYAGLFRAIGDGSVVKDFTLSECTFTNTANEVGAVAGLARYNALISGVTVTDTTVQGSGNIAGGIAGRLANGATVTDCIVDATVSGVRYVGGVAGGGDLGTALVKNCTVSGTVTGVAGVGGVVGSAHINGAAVTVTVEDCSVHAAVTGTSNQYIASGSNIGIGGVVGNVGTIGTAGSGYDDAVSVSGCSVSGSVSCTATTDVRGVGGIVGASNSNGSVTVSDCYVDAAISTATAGGRCGGMVGYSYATSSSKTVMVSSCVFAGSITLSGTNKNLSGGAIGQGVNTHPMVVTDFIMAGTITASEGALGYGVGKVLGTSVGTKSLNRIYAPITSPANMVGSDGSIAGNSVNVIHIANAMELVNTAKASKLTNFSGATLKLTEDIDLSGVDSFPLLGSDTCPFAGTLDWQDHTVSGFTNGSGETVTVREENAAELLSGEKAAT